MVKGSCLCGAVSYEYSGKITELAICHCQQCKQAQGTPFVTNAPIDEAKMTWLTGQEHLKSFFSSPNKRRVFCQTCGSPLFSQRTDMPETIRLRVGTITHGKIPQPNYQIYCQSKSNWLILNDQPQYNQNIIRGK